MPKHTKDEATNALDFLVSATADVNGNRQFHDKVKLALTVAKQFILDAEESAPPEPALPAPPRAPKGKWTDR